MDLLGTIEPTAETPTGKNAWIALIGVHAALAPLPSREGINPFTKEPMSYKAAPDSAQVISRGTEVGLIAWAEDNTQVLVAWAKAGAESQVASVAADVAARLRWQFVPSRAA